MHGSSDSPTVLGASWSPFLNKEKAGGEEMLVTDVKTARKARYFGTLSLVDASLKQS